MHYHSPRTYNFLRQFFNNHLPSPSTIVAWYSNSDLNTQPNSINEQCLNMLKTKAKEMHDKNGDVLVVSVLFDEIYLMKHVQWSNSAHKLVGYANKQESNANSNLDVANQALVIIVNGLNCSIRLPIAYYFIRSMDGHEKMRLMTNIIEKLIDCNIIVSNLTFDGFQANKTMCALLGADLKINSPTFKPYFDVKGQRIFIIFDACHMIKLIRNRFAAKQVLYDSHGSEIKWQYYVDLLKMKDHGFSLTHKITKSHIEWSNKKMKVNLAVETLSASTASSIEFLMRKGVPEFMNAESTVQFTRCWDTLFDIFNSKKDNSKNTFKNMLSYKNANEIFEFFDNSIEYIKGLKAKNDKGKLIRVCNSRINTGFNGFIINMVSLKLMFKEFVVEKHYMIMIRTSDIQQDPVEIFFGLVRSLGGHNDNPTCEQFSAAFRKLLAYSTVMYSKFSNCRPTEEVSNPYSNIMSITSRRKTATNLHDYSQVTEEKIDELYETLNDIQNLDHSKGLTDELEDYTIAHIAGSIEERIKSTKSFNCPACTLIFEENVKVDNSMFINSKSGQPLVCQSTYLICKQANRFLKTELLTGSIAFNVIYHEILKSMDIEALYSGTDFSSHGPHKIFLIRFVIDEYIRIKGTHLAKSATFNERQNSIRVKLHKLMHFLGQ